MHRLTPLVVAALSFTVAACAQSPAATTQAQAADASPDATDARPPNVVFILADDLGFGETEPYGQELIRTPHIARLAERGLRFTQAYTGAPVCAPARCILMTGLHGGHAEVRGNRDARPTYPEGQWPISADAYTLAELFQDHGYTTGGFGKWGLGHPESPGSPNAQGFDRFVGYNCQRVAHSFYPPHLWYDDEKVTINDNPIPGHARQPEGEVLHTDYTAEQYAPDLVLEEAVAFIEQAAEADEPFFAYLPFIEPHVAMQPPWEIVTAYPEAWDDRPYRGQCGYLPHPRPRAGYAAMITDLDEHVGTILDTLERLGVADNTLIVFTSDNGTTHPAGGDDVFGIGGVDAAFFNSTDGLRGFKGSLYEGGVRVPTLVAWPNHVAPESTTDFPTYSPDWFATFAEVLGTPDAAEHTDGISILPTLTGEGDQTPRNEMVWVYPEYGGQVAVRLGDFKVVRQGLNRDNVGDWQVYDIVNDRSETNDLAADRADLIEQAEDILRDQMPDNEVYPLTVPGVND